MTNFRVPSVAAFLIFAGAMVADASVWAAEDFRRAIKATIPHLFVVREVAEEVETAGAASDEVASSNRLWADSVAAAENYQQALRVADNLLATFDAQLGLRKPRWEVLCPESGWGPIEVAGFDKVTRIVLLRAPKDVLDAIACSVTPSVSGDNEMSWSAGQAEIGLPVVVVWNEGGRPCAKSSMVGAMGNVMARELATLDSSFGYHQVGSPILDVEGRLVGLVGLDVEDARNRASSEVLELTDVAAKVEELRSEEGTEKEIAATYQIYVDKAGRDREPADLIMPVGILNRLMKDVLATDQKVVLDYGFIGIRLGAGDSTIRYVFSGGAADQAKCTAGDKILSVNGVDVKTDADVMALVAEFRAGDSLKLELLPLSKASESSENGEPREIEPLEIEIVMRGLRQRRVEPSLPGGSVRPPADSK